ncbi:MAG: alpha/beta hydrolase [Planctomycetes bacterium]|nr:alpha/beta hydrolase [Planctomycetota bacterium]
MKVARKMTTWAVSLLGVYVALCALAWAFEKRLVYFPGPKPTHTPREYGLEHEELVVKTKDGQSLGAWFLPASRPRVAVLFCHGNAGSIEDRIEKARALLELGANVLLFDYRGYGASSGAPDESGTYLDAEAAYDALARRCAGLPIVLWGESLGGAVAIELALRRPIAALVVESTFTSVVDVGRHAYPWLPVRWLASLRYDNLAKIGGLAAPVLIAHSPADELVPFEHAERLFAAAREPKTLLETSGGHNAGGPLFDPACHPALDDLFTTAATAR